MKKLFIVILFLFLLIGIGFLLIPNNESNTSEIYTPKIVHTEEGSFMKEYNNLEKIATIRSVDTNEEKFSAQLKTPQINRVGAGYQKVAEFTLSPKQDINDVLGEFEFYDVNKNMKKIEKNIDIKYLVQEEVTENIYETICEDKELLKGCTEKIVGQRIVLKDNWLDFNNNIKTDEKITIGLFTNVQVGESVEWIPSISGVKIEEWAVWTQDLNVGLRSYYQFDETSGTNVIDIVAGFNGTSSNAIFTTGIQNGAYEYNGVNGKVLVPGRITHSGEWTYNFWINPETMTSTRFFNPMNDTLTILSINENFLGENELELFFAGSWRNTDVVITNNTSWTMVSLSYNGAGSVAIFKNGVASYSLSAFASAPADTMNALGSTVAGALWFDGKIDEYSVWNRSLDTAEYVQLYNSGLGLTYDNNLLSVSLLTPLNNTQTINKINDFSSEFINTNNLTINNITLSIWNSTGLVYNITNSSVDINGTFNQSFNNIELDYGEYEWNMNAVYENLTGGFEELNGVSNFSLEISNIVENSQSFNNVTTEGSSEDFSINLSVSDGIEISQGILKYNGSNISSSINFSGNDRLLSVTDFEIPTFSNQTNISFYWEIALSDGSFFNSSNQTQQVNVISLDNCSVFTYPLLNISLFDERERTPLNGTIELIYNVLNTPSFEEFKTMSGKFEGVTNTAVCSENDLYNQGFVYSAQIKYYADNYASELYNIQRSEIPQTFHNLSLYDLILNHSTEFKLIYQDNTYKYVEGAIVQLQRKYISSEDYEIVEAPLTSNEGTALVHVDLDSNLYRATIIKDGEVLDEFENLVFICESPLIGSCSQQLLGSVNPRNDIPISSISNFIYSDPVIVNETVSFSFSIPTGVPETIEISLVQQDQFGNYTLCNRSIIASAGLIECDFIKTIGDSFIDLKIYREDELMLQQSYIIPEEGAMDFLGNNFFIVIIFLLSLVGMSFTSPEWIIVNGLITFLLAGSLWLLNGLTFVVGLGTLAWLLIASAILIFKIAGQEDK